MGAPRQHKRWQERPRVIPTTPRPRCPISPPARHRCCSTRCSSSGSSKQSWLCRPRHCRGQGRPGGS
ncbi:hypothetical protein DUNSADRAFT_11145 [Dunaliella salina]|uniref:Encoded protein n=1 Tax=Dunaliella salina TaxID=3046 RepID=A0ABQ7GE18_DUNSA|nr:hypothetical protein DUNSADRAFT_11145 [Dunaliella salina]|eukprot:KAF5832843.1 hypothetical protein DUNSADRAFT_11145 [Dunaliella salina]